MLQTSRLDVPASLDSLKEARDFIENNARLAGLGHEQTGELLLAADEIVSNIAMHGGLEDSCTIALIFETDSKACKVTIRDSGIVFDPTAATSPDTNSSPNDNEAPGGFGILLAKRLVDQLDYQLTSDGMNELVILKKIIR